MLSNAMESVALSGTVYVLTFYVTALFHAHFISYKFFYCRNFLLVNFFAWFWPNLHLFRWLLGSISWYFKYCARHFSGEEVECQNVSGAQLLHQKKQSKSWGPGAIVSRNWPLVHENKIQWMSEIRTSLDFRQFSCVLFPDTFFCLKSEF